MSTNANAADQAEKTASPGKSKKLQDRRFLLAIFFVILPILLIYLLFKVFPPFPWPTETAQGSEQVLQNYPIWFLRGSFAISTSLEERLILLVIVMGAIGSYIHAATSFADFVGNDDFIESWTIWYILRPFIGVGLALVVYAAIRGGLLLLVTGGVTEASKINPFGVAAIAGLTGMFSKQAADKLNEVFSTIFKSSGDEKRKDSLTPDPAPTIASLELTEGSVAGGDVVKITGTGFTDGVQVTFGGQNAKAVTFSSATSLIATTPEHAAGKVDVVITNPDKQSVTLKEGFEYK